jgi:hypothetical protein
MNSKDIGQKPHLDLRLTQKCDPASDTVAQPSRLDHAAREALQDGVLPREK